MTISQVKEQLSMANVLGYYHLKPDKKLRLSCPFHEDKTPSMQVYYKTQTAYCFSGNCPTHGKSLDVIDFVMHKESCTKHEALEKCKAMIGGELKAKPMTELPRSAVLLKAWTYMCNAVGSSKTSRGYLESRGLDYKLLQDRKLGVGYQAGQMHHGARAEKHLIQSLLKVGLLSEVVGGRNNRTGGTAYRTFAKGSIVFGLRDIDGKVCGMYFRSTNADAKNGRHFYLRDRRGLYPKYPAASAKKLLLTESIIDAVSLLQSEQTALGWEVLALYGTNGFTAEHADAINELSELEEVCLFLNGDAAGRKATESIAEKIRVLRPGASISSVPVPEGEDCNSLLVKEGAELLAHMIEERVTLPSSIEVAAQRIETVEIENDLNRPNTVYEKKSEKNVLDVVNAYDLGYRAKSSELRIKGLKVDQLDSLKVTLQIRLS